MKPVRIVYHMKNGEKIKTKLPRGVWNNYNIVDDLLGNEWHDLGRIIIKTSEINYIETKVSNK